MKKSVIIALVAFATSVAVYAGGESKKTKPRNKAKVECCEKTKCCPTTQPCCDKKCE